MANVTIMDIAKAAGVSKATVSRVLNHPEIVDEKTRSAVRKIMEEKNYRPSVTARNLSNRKSSTIGVILPKVDNAFWGETLRGMMQVADENELTVMCFSTSDDERKDFQILQTVADQRVLGVIYVPAGIYEEKEKKKRLKFHLQALDAPVIVAERNIGLHYDGVFFDERQAAYEAVKAVIEEGHKNFVILNEGPDKLLTKERRRGICQALEESKFDLPPECIVENSLGKQGAYMLSKEIIGRVQQPTAVITCGDENAKGFLEVVYESGKQLGRDYQNVSIGQVEMLDVLKIPYSYIERDAYQMGKKTIEQLINRIAFPDKAPRNIIIEAPFIRQQL